MRRHPIRHAVRSYHRKGDSGSIFVHTYLRGKGIRINKFKSSPGYLGPKEDYRVMPPDKARRYLKYVKDSLHGDLTVNKTAGPVSLKLITVKRDQLDYYTSSRKDFEESVQYHIDEIKNGKTISPILVHKLPSGRFAILDGNARVEAYRCLGITEYPAVENGLLDAISKAGEKLKKYGKQAVKIGTKFVKKGGEIAVSMAKEGIKKGSAVAVDIAKKGAKAGVEAIKESAIEAYGKVEQENVKKLIEVALYDPNQAKRNFAKTTLKNFYPNIYDVLDFQKLDREIALQKIAERAKTEHTMLVKYAPK